jgi:hypothetical protein
LNPCFKTLKSSFDKAKQRIGKLKRSFIQIILCFIFKKQGFISQKTAKKQARNAVWIAQNKDKTTQTSDSKIHIKDSKNRIFD